MVRLVHQWLFQKGKKKKKTAKNNNLHTMGRRFKDLKFKEGIKNKKIEDTKIYRLGGNLLENFIHKSLLKGLQNSRMGQKPTKLTQTH
ncbi:hypothetical protein Tco_1519626 [Tanacetum coccineum]